MLGSDNIGSIISLNPSIHSRSMAAIQEFAITRCTPTALLLTHLVLGQVVWPHEHGQTVRVATAAAIGRRLQSEK